MSPDALAKTITPILIPMAKDSVANVRMNVAKTLKIIIPLMKDAKSTEVINKICFIK
jgi:hypothetical protein